MTEDTGKRQQELQRQQPEKANDAADLRAHSVTNVNRKETKLRGEKVEIFEEPVAWGLQLLMF